MWDWVGGRYSLWSAVGLSIALALGMDQFEAMLAGGHDMDEHFRSAPLEQNLPVLMGLIGVWNKNFLGCDSLAVLPYDQRLHRFPAYLQQLEMESNGKSVTRGGAPVDYRDRDRHLGRAGQQRAAFVLPAAAPGHGARCAWISSRRSTPRADSRQQQDLALANCFAQAEAFAFGQTGAQVRADLQATGLRAPGLERLVPHKVHRRQPAVQPDPVPAARAPQRSVGCIAWYEHKVYVQSVIWDINPFDQWGVELGKKLATSMTEPVMSGQWANGPAHMQNLLAQVQRWRGD